MLAIPSGGTPEFSTSGGKPGPSLGAGMAEQVSLESEIAMERQTVISGPPSRRQTKP
jgi:hypothetical protein